MSATNFGDTPYTTADGKVIPHTVDAYRAHIREKLGLGDGNDLTRQAFRWVEVGMIR